MIPLKRHMKQVNQQTRRHTSNGHWMLSKSWIPLVMFSRWFLRCCHLNIWFQLLVNNLVQFAFNHSRCHHHSTFVHLASFIMVHSLPGHTHTLYSVNLNNITTMKFYSKIHNIHFIVNCIFHFKFFKNEQRQNERMLKEW